MKYTKIYLLSVLKYQRVAYIISFGVNKCLKNVYKIVRHCKSVLFLEMYIRCFNKQNNCLCFSIFLIALKLMLVRQK